MRAIAHAATDHFGAAATYAAAAAYFTGFVLAIEAALSKLVY